MNLSIELKWMTSRWQSGPGWRWSMVLMSQATSNKPGPDSHRDVNEIVGESVGGFGSPTKELEKAFLKTIGEHSGMIDLICRSHTNNQADRKDLYQEVVRQLWSAYPSFKGKSQISTWIGGVALRVAKLPFRQKRIEIDYVENVPEQPDTPAREMDERLFRLYHQLGESEQQVITLYLQGFSREEIAVLMELSEVSIRRRLARIKKEAEKDQKNKQ